MEIRLHRMIDPDPMKTSPQSAYRALTRAAVASIVLALPLAAGCGGESSSGEGAASPAGGATHELVGNPAPTFTMKTVNGKGDVNMEKLKGKVILVDFWATWCEPCKKSFPKLQELNTKYKPNLVVIGISQDDENQGLQDFAKTFGAEFPIGWDDAKNIAKKYNPKSMPSSFIVDQSGVVRFAHVGWHDGEMEEVEKELKSLM
jgi:cytochrome c biogenesis protein CcmG/thiol:disulfide interchange protein DsbE